MSLRALFYIAAAYRGLVGSKRRRTRLGPRGRLPPTLTVTIYNGRRPWTAPDDIFDLIEPVQGRLAERQPRLPHQVLDLREHRERLDRARAEMLAEGRAEGRVSLVCRQARLKFGAGAAEALSGLLEGITDADRIARIGDLIIECETGAELLERARED